MNKEGIATIIIALIVVAVITLSYLAYLGYFAYSSYKTPIIETGNPSTGGNGESDISSEDSSFTSYEDDSDSPSGDSDSSTDLDSEDPSGLESSNSTSPPVGSSGPAAVNLRTAGNFVILSKSGISTTGTTSIVGNIGVSPIDSTAITGFGLIMDPSNTFATSSLVTGRIYAADYTAPTPTTMTTATSDMETAYADAAGRTNPTSTELGAGNIGGMTITPGTYKWGTGLIIPTDVTLNCGGNSNAVFIFQIEQTLSISSGKKIILSGGCQAKNIFWQVAGQVTLGTTSNFKGNILSATLIEMNTGATLNGRALAQTAVTLDANTITIPN